jgi:hypothetical protein
MTNKPEPSEITYQKIGALCVAWAFLEMQTEIALRGMLGLNDSQTKVLVWNLKLTDRCAKLKSIAKERLSGLELEELDTLCTKIAKTADDHNIIIHGIVHAAIYHPKQLPPEGFTTIHDALHEQKVVQVPCWTIFQGNGKGKNFPISSDAVEVVCSKVKTLGFSLKEFNKRNNFKFSPMLSDHVERDWPKPL